MTILLGSAHDRERVPAQQHHDIQFAETITLTGAGNQSRESAQSILQQAFKEISAEMMIEQGYRPNSYLATNVDNASKWTLAEE